jgi:hypothetical protein
MVRAARFPFPVGAGSGYGSLTCTHAKHRFVDRKPVVNFHEGASQRLGVVLNLTDERGPTRAWVEPPISGMESLHRDRMDSHTRRSGCSREYRHD